MIHVSTSETVTSVQTDCATTQTPGSCAVCKETMYDESDGSPVYAAVTAAACWEDRSTVCCADIQVGKMEVFIVIRSRHVLLSLPDQGLYFTRLEAIRPKHKVHPAIAATQNSRDTLPPYWNPIMAIECFSRRSGIRGVRTRRLLCSRSSTQREVCIATSRFSRSTEHGSLEFVCRRYPAGARAQRRAKPGAELALPRSSGDVTDEIAQGGFNRSFVGRHATRTARASILRGTLVIVRTHCTATGRERSSNQYSWRAVVGEYCLGVQGALVPAMRDATTHAHYDDINLQNPNISSRDAQAFALSS